jgi:AcrR family transcriptional regulator
MPRVRADDYDAKSRSILDSAAGLFAKVGYPNAKMQDIAEACGTSKSMLYHYYPTKDDLLFAMLQEHLENLIASFDEIAAQPGSASQRFSTFVQAYVQKSAQSRRRHLSAMNDIKFLPKKLQTPLLALESKVTNQLTAMLRELNPNIPDEAYKPYTMLLIGMLNWTDLWYKPAGKVKPQELCERISRLFLKGFLAEKGA